MWQLLCWQKGEHCSRALKRTKFRHQQVIRHSSTMFTKFKRKIITAHQEDIVACQNSTGIHYLCLRWALPNSFLPRFTALNLTLPFRERAISFNLLLGNIIFSFVCSISILAQYFDHAVYIIPIICEHSVTLTPVSRQIMIFIICRHTYSLGLTRERWNGWAFSRDLMLLS